MSDLIDEGISNCSIWEERDYSLVFCRRENDEGQKEILLGLKKRGFGVGKYNGFGGKLEKEETMEMCARRELEEESGIIATIERMGFLCFKMIELNKIMRDHVYQTYQFNSLNIQESDEMRPQWFSENEIPFNKMWVNDQYWLPLLLQGKQFIGRFEYEDDDTITDYSVKEQL